MAVAGSVTGLNSGIQWDQTVQLLMQNESRPVTLLQQRVTNYQTQLSNWSTIESKLNSLKAAAEAMDTANELLVKGISTSDDAILTASADSTAIPASHQVLVNRLATNHILVHTAGWADKDTTTVNSSGVDQSLSYSYAGENFTVTVPDGTTLSGLVRLINNDPDNPGVTASILNDGSGGAGAFHLVLSGQETGADNTVAILDTLANPTDLGDGAQFDASNWDTTQTAQNAQIRVDGFPDPGWGWPDPWIESASNDVKDVIPGVTLHLHDVTTGTPVHIDISLDKAATKSKVNALVTAYNDLIGNITTMTSYDANAKTAGPLANDSLARSVSNQLMTLIASNIPGTDASDRYRSLGEVGLSIESGGQLSLDEEKFDDALDTDATSVARLFVFDATTSSGYVTVAGHGIDTQGGSYGFTLSYNASGALDSGGTNTIDGKNVTIHGNSLAAAGSDSPVSGLLLLLANPGDGPASLNGTVKVYKGLSALLASKISDLTDSLDGSLANNDTRINDSIQYLNDQIDSWNKRLQTIENNYNTQFQQMETLIGQLKTQSNYLSGTLG
jgi:flagellar hook-associated protein 2